MSKEKTMTQKKKIVMAVCIAVAVALVVTLLVGNLYDYWWLKVYIVARRIGYNNDNKTCETGHVVFVGDSITDSCDLARYYPGLDAYNRGISGDVTEGVLARIDNIVALEPTLVVLHIGTNDYQRCHAGERTNEHILANIRRILDAFHTRLPDTKVIVQSVYPIANVSFKMHYANGHGHIEDLNASIATLAAEYGYTYADVYPLLVTGDEEMDMQYSVDGLHPNDLGYQVISAYLRPIIDQMLAE